MRAVRVTTLALAVVVAILVAPAGVARAHSFLAATDSVQGTRLERAPEDVALQFSEAIAAGSVLAGAAVLVNATPPQPANDPASLLGPPPSTGRSCTTWGWLVPSRST